MRWAGSSGLIELWQVRPSRASTLQQATNAAPWLSFAELEILSLHELCLADADTVHR